MEMKFLCYNELSTKKMLKFVILRFQSITEPTLYMLKFSDEEDYIANSRTNINIRQVN